MQNYSRRQVAASSSALLSLPKCPVRCGRSLRGQQGAPKRIPHRPRNMQGLQVSRGWDNPPPSGDCSSAVRHDIDGHATRCDECMRTSNPWRSDEYVNDTNGPNASPVSRTGPSDNVAQAARKTYVGPAPMAVIAAAKKQDQANS